jgi:hypothetical protein
MPLAGSYTSTFNSMATSIRFDAATESNGDGTDHITEPWNHTTGDHESPVMLVAVANAELDDTVQSVTYNGQTLTEIAHLTIGAARLWVGFLAAPAVGTHEVNIAFGPGGVQVARACALTFYSVYENDPIGQTASESVENDLPTEFATDIDPDAAEGMVVSFYYGSRGITGNAQSPLNEVINITGDWEGGAGGVSKILGAAYDEHSGSIYTATWENLTHDSSNADQFQVLVELNEKPVAAVLGGTII